MPDSFKVDFIAACPRCGKDVWWEGKGSTVLTDRTYIFGVTSTPGTDCDCEEIDASTQTP